MIINHAAIGLFRALVQTQGVRCLGGFVPEPDFVWWSPKGSTCSHPNRQTSLLYFGWTLAHDDPCLPDKKVRVGWTPLVSGVDFYFGKRENSTGLQRYGHKNFWTVFADALGSGYYFARHEGKSIEPEMATKVWLDFKGGRADAQSKSYGRTIEEKFDAYYGLDASIYPLRELKDA